MLMETMSLFPQNFGEMLRNSLCMASLQWLKLLLERLLSSIAIKLL